jgi:hypothetical protein
LGLIVQSFPGSGYYVINVSDKSAYLVNFGNFRPYRASDEYDETIFTDADGKMLTTMRITPEMTEKERLMRQGLPKTHIDPRNDARLTMALMGD